MSEDLNQGLEGITVAETRLGDIDGEAGELGAFRADLADRREVGEEVHAVLERAAREEKPPHPPPLAVRRPLAPDVDARRGARRPRDGRSSAGVSRSYANGPVKPGKFTRTDGNDEPVLGRSRPEKSRMDMLELPNRSPDASTTVEPGESTTDALARLAERVDADLTRTDPRLQDVVDGNALDRLFSVGEATNDARTVLVLELWDRLFVLTPVKIEVYR